MHSTGRNPLTRSRGDSAKFLDVTEKPVQMVAPELVVEPQLVLGYLHLLCMC